MNDLTFQVLKIVLTACTAILTVYLIPYLKTLKDNKRYGNLVEIIGVAVRAAEQTIREAGQGAAKKEQVVETVREWMNARGIDITYDQLSQLIEAAVYSMKQEAVK